MSTNSFKIKSIHKTTSITYDSHGIPTINADHLEDLFFAQGFVSARDRFFQMDYSRRAVSGRISQLVGVKTLRNAPTLIFEGKSTLDLDRFMLSVGMKKAAETSLKELPSDIKKYLFAFSRGVNEGIKQSPTPPEYFLLRSPQLEWHPVDTLLLIKAMAFELNVAWRAKLFMIAASRSFEDKHPLLEHLFPSHSREYPIRSHKLSCMLDKSQALSFSVNSETYRFFSGMGGAHLGSNAWAVGPQKTESGQAMLANDPHLMLSAPCRWYTYKFNFQGDRFYGSNIPGVPGAVIGRNENFAIGVTNGSQDDTDFYLENCSKNHYLVDGEQKSIQERMEFIPLKDGKVLEHKVYETHRGPLLSKVLDMQDRFDLPELSMCWGALHTRTEAEAIIGLLGVSDFEGLKREAFKTCTPALNFIYSDRQGNIGYVYGGHIPIRPSNRMEFLYDGTNTDNDWKGFVKDEERPFVLNPEEGFVVTANNKICSDDYPYYISDFWEPPNRYDRICEHLLSKQKLTAKDFIAIQNDCSSSFARKMAHDVFVRILRNENTEDKIAVVLKDFEAWDGSSNANDRLAPIFYRALGKFIRRVFNRVLGKEFARFYFEQANSGVYTIESIFSEPKLVNKIFSDRNLLVDDLKKSLHYTLKELDREFPDFSPEWGDIHSVQLRHVFFGNKVLRKVFCPGPIKSGGDGSSVNQGFFPLGSTDQRQLVGAGLRLIVDFSNYDYFYQVLCGGQNGRVHSKNYADQLKLWERGEYLKLKWNAKEDLPCHEIYFHQ